MMMLCCKMAPGFFLSQQAEGVETSANPFTAALRLAAVFDSICSKVGLLVAPACCLKEKLEAILQHSFCIRKASSQP